MLVLQQKEGIQVPEMSPEALIEERNRQRYKDTTRMKPIEQLPDRCR